MKRLISLAVLLFPWALHAGTQTDYLVQVTPELKAQIFQLQALTPKGTKTEDLKVNNWIRVQLPQNTKFSMQALKSHPGVLHVQKNYKLGLFKNASLEKARAEFLKRKKKKPAPGQGGFPGMQEPPADNPDIPTTGSGGSGADPLFEHQWGMNQIGVKNSWEKAKGEDVVVAVIDTGVDYTHEDLVDNMWRNPGETGKDADGNDKATNGKDDDNNGYVDDVVGWDFVSNDNKPFDLAVGLMEMLFGGGNPGHGTHCAGNVGARGDNGKGVVGVAPKVKIMALRFISEKGQGTTADAIKAIKYATDNGAKVTSNSWGSEGEDPEDNEGNKALRDAITYAGEKGGLFVAAAGNGHQGKGYDNDNDDKPAYPASYDHDNIISVAAIDEKGDFGSFSNWGVKSVDVGAPGVKVYSTTVGSHYNDVVADLSMIGMGIVTWDGTSMATPHVAGAAALYWSANPEKTWKEVKAAIMASVKKTSQMSRKVSSDGALDVEALMKQ